MDHNLFDFDVEDDKGNLISDFGRTTSEGGTKFHNNLISNPGRGLIWTNSPYNNYSFYNNHVWANKTVTPRTDGLFGFNKNTDFSTIVIKDNIIECYDLDRPLLRIDGQAVASWTNVGGSFSGEYVTYSYTADAEVSASQIRVAFTNDDGQDRDLRIDKIEADGVAYQSEASTTYSTGTWTASNGCAGGFKRSEWLHCNGYFAYNQSNARTADAKTLAKELDVSEVQLFPNPAQDVVRVRLPSREGKAVIIVSDMLGQEILRRQTSTNNIDLPVHQLTPGLYQIRVRQGGQEVKRKLLIDS